MQPLDLNLATRPFRNNTLLWTGYGGALLLLLLFTYWNVTSFTEHRRLLRDSRDVAMSALNRRDELNKRNVEANLATDRDYDIAGLGAQAEKANEVIEWKAFSWTRLFNRMEQAQPWNVRLASIRPVFRSERGQGGADLSGVGRKSLPVVVEGSAQDFQALLDFERALFEDSQFDRPEPERENISETGEVVFTLRFTYYPESIEEPAADPPAEEEVQEGDAVVAGADPEADPDDATEAVQATRKPDEADADGPPAELNAPNAETGEDPS